MEVSGPVVDKLQYESDKTWARAGILGDFANFVAFMKGKKERADKDGYPVRILQTRNLDSDIHKAQIAAIQNAQSYILIENAYFSDDRTVYELARARRRGVDVRIIIPSRGNHGALNASNKITINTLIKNGIRVYEYPGMSHVKAAIFDGWVSVGSANFDKLSLKVNKRYDGIKGAESTRQNYRGNAISRDRGRRTAIIVTNLTSVLAMGVRRLKCRS